MLALAVRYELATEDSVPETVPPQKRMRIESPPAIVTSTDPPAMVTSTDPPAISQSMTVESIPQIMDVGNMSM